MAKALSVFYPEQSEGETDKLYAWVLLRKAMEASGKDFIMRQVPLSIQNRKRVISKWKQGDESITVFWAGTNKAFEQDAMPVRIPIMGGLLGLRLFLINRHDQEKFNKVETLENLAAYEGAQGLGWADVEILKHAGLKTEEHQYRQLFMMLNNQRFDYFSRGVTEIYHELAQQGQKYSDLAVEKTLALRYPFAGFFFVSKDNKALHDAIELGLKRMHENGQFQELFRTHPATSDALELARLPERKIFDIENPTMSRETLSIPKKYWFDLNWLKQD